jgi:hypothetical protein
MITNDSSLATIETDEERSFIFIDLPSRADMVKNMAIKEIIRYNDTKTGDFTKDFTKETHIHTYNSERPCQLQQKDLLRRDGCRKTVTCCYFSDHWTNCA